MGRRRRLTIFLAPEERRISFAARRSSSIGFARFRAPGPRLAQVARTPSVHIGKGSCLPPVCRPLYRRACSYSLCGNNENCPRQMQALSIPMSLTCSKHVLKPRRLCVPNETLPARGTLPISYNLSNKVNNIYNNRPVSHL